jgi:hypothetical protein
MRNAMLEMIRRGLALLSAKLRDPDVPPEPYAPVRHPRGAGPGGRYSSIALDEPREPTRVEAVSRDRGRSS